MFILSNDLNGKLPEICEFIMLKRAIYANGHSVNDLLNEPSMQKIHIFADCITFI